RGLNELAGPRPDRLYAAARSLARRVANEVVLDARAEVVSALDPLQNVAIEDQVDTVRGVKAKRRDRIVVDLRLVGTWDQIAGHAVVERVSITRCPAEVELQPQTIFHQLLLDFRGQTKLRQVELRAVAEGVLGVGRDGSAADTPQHG